MNVLAGRVLAFALVAATGAASAQELQGLWRLSVRDLTHKEIATMTIRFTDTPGASCIGGEWKRIQVEAAASSDPKFFPAHDELTYRIENSELVIGRNGVCDGYLRLRGKLDAKAIQGAYYTLGLGGGSDLGDFSLVPAR